jgi:hypothetical protein
MKGEKSNAICAFCFLDLIRHAAGSAAQMIILNLPASAMRRRLVRRSLPWLIKG